MLDLFPLGLGSFDVFLSLSLHLFSLLFLLKLLQLLLVRRLLLLQVLLFLAPQRKETRAKHIMCGRFVLTSPGKNLAEQSTEQLLICKQNRG